MGIAALNPSYETFDKRDGYRYAQSIPRFLIHWVPLRP